MFRGNRTTTSLYSDIANGTLPTVSFEELWESTAIFITTDEGGGYYDSGSVQPLDWRRHAHPLDRGFTTRKTGPYLARLCRPRFDS